MYIHYIYNICTIYIVFIQYICNIYDKLFSSAFYLFTNSLLTQYLCLCNKCVLHFILQFFSGTSTGHGKDKQD